jgi:flagellar motility protein MotE (MotC chaperone)
VIVTRQRKRRGSPARYLIPLAIIAVIGFLLGFPPSQRLIANGPLKPAWDAGANAGAVVVRPLTFAGQQQTIADRNREIRDLDARLEAQRKAKADADARAERLQQQLAALQNQPVVTPAPVPRSAAIPAPLGAAIAAGPSAGGRAAAVPTDDEKRLAATWAAMDPEKAAAIAQRLPDAEVSRVLGAMDADSAGAIMNALPPPAAARISRAVAQVPPAPVR